jgi:glycerol kinase
VVPIQRFILALDQGTTGSAALVFDANGWVIASSDSEIRQSYPQPGWVEHDPIEIYETTVSVGRKALELAGARADEVAAIGIANQRETAVIWERDGGRPIHPAVVWQSRASADICDRLRADGLEPLFRERTGLLLDAYFSGTKIRWILDRVPGAQQRAEAGELLFGTIETWLIWKLTGGRLHVTDVTNASRTLLLNIGTAEWDDELLGILNVSRGMLPSVVSNADPYGETESEVFGVSIPIAGMAGDQQAALFGHACFQPGEAKNTYGTGCFLLENIGTETRLSDAGLLTTIGAQVGARRTYALEGSVFTAGAAVQWLRDGLGLIRTAGESERLARSVDHTGGLYLVPAFAGLGAPYWDMYARGLMIGITGGTTGEHIVRATLESIAYQTRDLMDAMSVAGEPISTLRVDGGGTANGFLMQFQSDILGIPVEVSGVQEMTALGAAYLAGLGSGFWKSATDLPTPWAGQKRYEPMMSVDQRDSLYAGWRRAVERSKGWAG